MSTAIRRKHWLLPWLGLLGGMSVLGLFFLLIAPPSASAHVGAAFNSTCGRAVIDGNVHTAEWSGAAHQTVQMVSSATTPFTVTIYVMNTHDTLYMGFTINDSEFNTSAQYLPEGDSFRIDFDNDHHGALEALNDDVLSLQAGLPQFNDNYIANTTYGSSESDDLGGGTVDGLGAASRVDSLNHFELRHPLCSGDSLDFCLHPADTVGFRLEYLDAQADNVFGGSHYYPGVTNTDETDIVIASCTQGDYTAFLPLIQK